MAATTAPEPRRRPAHLETHRLTLADGTRTSLHVARHRLDRTELRVVRLRRSQPLAAWCEREGVEEALVGGFFDRKAGDRPIGEVRTGGMKRRTTPFDAPWGALRACVWAGPAGVRIARRPDLPAAPAGDLLQAGPLLVSAGMPCVAGDPEGFSAGSRQFDSDITAGRHPRAALATTATHLLAVACDGRVAEEAGLTLAELAEALAALGAREALNLDGGGSTSLVCHGHLRNAPYEQEGVPIPGGRPVSTALTFLPR
jgi:hypothetical protein